jgi:hypothetical protein
MEADMSNIDEYFKHDDSEEFGELVFNTDIADKPDKPWWYRLLIGIVCGAAIGLLLWLKYEWFKLDRTWDWIHLAAWAGGGAVVTGILVSLPFFRKTELKKIHVWEKGFRVFDRSGQQDYAWSELEAAHFETYPIPNLHTEIHCFEFRTAGKNIQLTIDGLGNKLPLFYEVMDRFLEQNQIARETKQLRTFDHILSLCGAWLFAGSMVLTVVAHLLAFYTLGTLIGICLLLTGAVLAFMSREKNLSKWILAAAVVVILGTVGAVYGFNINIRSTLLEWEKRERSLGRPPWSDIKPVNDSNQRCEP